MTPRYEIVVFDLDGTLVDSYDALTEAVNHVRRIHGLDDFTRLDIRARVGHGVQVLLERSFERVPVDARERFEDRYDEVCCEQSQLLEGVVSTLEHLSSMGVAMAVCTNKPTYFSTKILEYIGISSHFVAIIGPDVVGSCKPDAMHLRYAIDRAREVRPGTDDASVLFVGDMPVDIHAARNCGVDVAVLATGSSSAPELREAQPDYFLERFADLIEIVNGSVRVGS